MDERSESSSQGTNEQAEVASQPRCHYSRQAWFGDEGTSTCPLSRPARVEPGNISYDLDRSNDDPDVCILYEYWKARPDLVAHFELPHIKAFPKVLPEVLESEMDLRHWFDHYEDRKRN